MKKILILLLILVIFTGCNNKVNSEKEIYLKYINELKETNSSNEEYPFTLEIVLDKITKKEVRYQVILDNVKENLDDISIISIHDKKTDDIYPSIGIFDSKEKLRVNEKPSGLILVGYIDYEGDIKDFNATFKVLVKYKIKGKEYKVHYVTKK